jgi:uncharacterized protein YjbI with pentapeptide repeats
MAEEILNAEKSEITLTEADIQSLISWYDNENPRHTPISSKTLTEQDIDFAIQSWRGKNGHPQLPVGDWWQKDCKWYQGPNLAGLDFSHLHLEDKDLDGIILAYANLRGTVFRQSTAIGAWLFRTDLQGADCFKADFSKANFVEANLTGTEFWGAKLCEARFTGAVLERTRLLGADLSGAYFRKSRLNYTEMKSSQLGGAIGEERDKEYKEQRRLILC